MKLSTGFNLIGDWRLFFTTSLTCLSLFHRSEVAGATVNVISPSISNLNLSSYSNKITPPPTPPPAPPPPPLNINQPEGLEEGIENQILGEILRLDSLKCFPKLLCTIYQDKEITRQGFFVNATELALAYIKLIRAVHYTSPTRRTTTEAPIRKKQPIIQIFKIPLGLITASTYQGRRSPFKRHPHKHHHHRLEADDYDPDEEHDDFRRDHPYHSRSPLSFRDQDDNGDEDEDDDSFPYGRRTAIRGDDEEREFLREKVRMTQMMKDLKDEDNAEMEAPESGGLATTLLSSFLPFVGSRSRREERSLVLAASNTEPPKPTHSRRSGRRRSKSQDPFWKAVSMWRKLRRRTQCQSMYKTCPMEAWEMVRMLDLVKGQSQVLATYLKITVDNAKPIPRRKGR